jgi:RNA polymerase sigma factor (sigma-70 family)
MSDSKDQRWLEDQLNLLTPLQQRVLILRFGLNGERSRSMSEVGQELEIDEERIRQEEREALKRIRRARP